MAPALLEDDHDSAHDELHCDDQDLHDLNDAQVEQVPGDGVGEALGPIDARLWHAVCDERWVADGFGDLDVGWVGVFAVEPRILEVQADHDQGEEPHEARDGREEERDEEPPCSTRGGVGGVHFFHVRYLGVVHGLPVGSRLRCAVPDS